MCEWNSGCYCHWTEEMNNDFLDWKYEEYVAETENPMSFDEWFDSWYKS
ncbi:hypothetical protein [Chengkuizengella axinellae]|uniref:Uncharacterized protein n=1 Tax=Chengkuizengella axinellae TaxID=3064388 RepID=A0ABT9J6N4_9BACL|nr:hypothetical protein [Chengkuizengella sp. 2205SS18-9]MDP5277272.1 hypothetical protein [Chengkuizengella sp. 2205SS18-9]